MKLCVLYSGLCLPNDVGRLLFSPRRNFTVDNTFTVIRVVNDCTVLVFTMCPLLIQILVDTSNLTVKDFTSYLV